MKREIKFRAWDGNRVYYFDNHQFNLEYNDISGWNIYPNQPNYRGKYTTGESSESAEKFTLMQFTGLQDKHGKDIYEGDIISFCRPIRTTQTHVGDNIPNGSYTEPMEPGIEHFEGEVKFENGCFVFEDYNKDGSSYPLEWNIQEWDEESIKEAISYGRPDRFVWDDPEEGDMQYLLEENNFTDLQSLIDYLSGVEVTGNIYEQA